MAPKSSTLGQGITIQYLGGPFVAILGHFGPYLVHFGVILAARARGWGQFGANFSPFKLLKTAWMTRNQVQWARLWTHGTSGGLLRPFFGHFGVISAARARNWGQFGANFSPFRLFKTDWMTKNHMQWVRLWTHGTSGGPLRANFGHFGVILAARVRGFRGCNA